MTRILISDAYSTSNVGDGELVRLTVEIAERSASHITLLSTDPVSFAADSRFAAVHAHVEKPLSRAAFRQRGNPKRLVWLVGQALALGTSAVTSMLPVAPSRKRALLRKAAKVLKVEWLQALASADRVVAVGGGYLGDKYARESALSLLLYRAAHSLGIPVETMPISISGLSHPVLRWWFKTNAKTARWRAREEITRATIASIGGEVNLCPDLAWLNAAQDASTNDSAGCKSLAVAPLGSSFYASKHSQTLEEVLELTFVNYPSLERVTLIPMHSWTRSLDDGKDDKTCERLQTWMQERKPDLEVRVAQPRSYDDVLHLMRGSDMAICQRLHAAIAALCAGTATTVLAYEPKHKGVMGLADLEDLLEPGKVTPDAALRERIRTAAMAQRQILEREFYGANSPR